MNESKLIDLISRIHARSMAHEHILRQLIVKTASHSGRPRDAWILELRREIAEAVRAFEEINGSGADAKSMTADILAEIDRVVKVSDL